MGRERRKNDGDSLLCLTLSQQRLQDICVLLTQAPSLVKVFWLQSVPAPLPTALCTPCCAAMGVEQIVWSWACLSTFQSQTREGQETGGEQQLCGWSQVLSASPVSLGAAPSLGPGLGQDAARNRKLGAGEG